MSASIDKKKTGPKPKDIPAAEVEKLASFGCSQVEIADFFNVDPVTIRRRFSAEMQRGKAGTKIRLRQSQLKSALEGNVTMMIWLGKQILNQSDNGTYEVDDLLDEITFTLDEHK